MTAFVICKLTEEHPVVDLTLFKKCNKRWAPLTLNRLVEQQTYMLAAYDVFCASALIFLLLISLAFLTRPLQAGAGRANAEAGAH